MWALRKDGCEAAIDLKAVPGIGAEIVRTVDGELRRRNWSPAWVPAGMVTRERPPSMLGTSTCAPSAAWVIRSGTRTKMFAPSRWKIGCALTEMST